MTQHKKVISPEQAQGFFRQVTEHVINAGGVAELYFSPDENKLGARLSHPKIKSDTSDVFANICAQSAKEVLESACKIEIFSAPTFQRVPNIHLRPDIGCFVQFNGDYSGLMIMNFSAGAAMTLYRESMLSMGFPTEELSIEHTSDDVVNTIGELINQIIGNVRKRIDDQFGLVSKNSQPKAIAINSSISLSIETNPKVTALYRRISLKAANELFQIEIALENTEFAQTINQKSPPETTSNQVDIP